MMPYRKPAFAAAIALSLTLGLSACGGATTMANRSLNSVHQPIVGTSTYALDLTAGSAGMPLAEQRRLADWLETMDVGYGDRLSVESASSNDAVRAEIAAIAARRGLLLSDATPFTPAAIAPGSVRVTLTRSRAQVQGCPDWTGRPGSGTSANYGCATNSNLAAMVADPQHLLKGAQGTGETVVMTSNKAIATYREQPTTGAGGLAQTQTTED